MKRLILTAALLATMTLPAIADDKASPTNAPLPTTKLTVLQLINIADALRQLGDYRNGKNEEVKVPFKFDAGTTMTFAININHADEVQTVYNKQLQALKQKELGDRLDRLAALDKAAADETDDKAKKLKTAGADALRAEINAIAQRIADANNAMLAAPAGAFLSRIKMADLCMASEPVKPCTTTNSIPPSLLAALVPIIDQ